MITEIIEKLLSQNGFVDIEKMDIKNNEATGFSCVYSTDNIIGIICIQDDKFMFSSIHDVEINNFPRLLTVVNDFVDLYNINVHVHQERIYFNSVEQKYTDEQALIKEFINFVQGNIEYCDQILKLLKTKNHEIVTRMLTCLKRSSDFAITEEHENFLIATNKKNGELQILSTPTSNYQGVLTYSIPIKEIEASMINYLNSISLNYVFYYKANRLYVKTWHLHGECFPKIFEEIAFLKYFAENVEKCFETLYASPESFFQIIDSEITPYAEKLKKECLYEF